MFAKELRESGVLNCSKEITNQTIDNILIQCEGLVEEKHWDVKHKIAALLIDAINHVSKLQGIQAHDEAMTLNHVLNGNQVKNAFYSNQNHNKELMEAAISKNDSALLIEKAKLIAEMLDGYKEADSRATYKLVRIA